MARSTTRKRKRRSVHPLRKSSNHTSSKIKSTRRYKRKRSRSKRTRAAAPDGSWHGPFRSLGHEIQMKKTPEPPSEADRAKQYEADFFKNVVEEAKRRRHHSPTSAFRMGAAKDLQEEAKQARDYLAKIDNSCWVDFEKLLDAMKGKGSRIILLRLLPQAASRGPWTINRKRITGSIVKNKITKIIEYMRSVHGTQKWDLVLENVMNELPSPWPKAKHAVKVKRSIRMSPRQRSIGSPGTRSTRPSLLVPRT